MSAQSENYVIAWDGSFWLVDGTSCSTPFFASMVALINDKLISAGGAPLGFLNPLIYSATDAFTDITSGDNPGCSTNGFSSTTGWDPVRNITALLELETDSSFHVDRSLVSALPFSLHCSLLPAVPRTFLFWGIIN